MANLNKNRTVFKIVFISAILLLINNFSFAQLTLNNGNHVLEISGGIGSYYGYRLLDDDLSVTDANDFKKNRFNLKDAQLQFEGRIGDIYEYELQFDLADMASGRVDPEEPGLMDAYIAYKGLNFVNITLGYTKLPYSLSSMTPNVFSPIYNRAEVVRGNVFSRRDVGITLSQDLWQQRINLYLGAYTGLGAISLQGNNDAGGKLEYLSRVDVSYPSRLKYRLIDDTHTPIPLFSIGFNGRYADKSITTGSDYYMLTIDGKKYTYGMDFSAFYQGFSLLYEIHQIRMEPNTPEKMLGYIRDYVMAGGWYGQLNYHSIKLKTTFSVRYETLNLNDLAMGQNRLLTGGLAYMINGFNSIVRIQFQHVLEEEELPYFNGYKWTDEIKIGWTVLFK